MIPYAKQSIGDDEIAAVVAVLKSDFITQGPLVAEFERGIANYCGAEYAVACSNATAGLHLACLALGIGKGDIVWTSANTFVASANAALYCGAGVDFIDICPRTYNISIEHLTEKLKRAKQRNQLPKALIPVHFAGQSCDMEKIYLLSQEYGFYIIEDASHAIGGRYKASSIGGCQYSHLSVFSMHPAKIITTGEGGIVTTNQAGLAEKLLRLRSHGITRDAGIMRGESEGDWYYQQLELGFNYRITDIQCALGVQQLKKIDEFVAQRNALAKFYQENLSDLPVQLPVVEAENYSAFHLYVIQLDTALTKLARSVLFKYLRDNDVGVNVHYIPVYLQPYYQDMGFVKGLCPNAEKYYYNALTIPLFPTLTQAEQLKVIHTLRNAAW